MLNRHKNRWKTLIDFVKAGKQAMENFNRIFSLLYLVFSVYKSTVSDINMLDSQKAQLGRLIKQTQKIKILSHGGTKSVILFLALLLYSINHLAQHNFVLYLTISYLLDPSHHLNPSLYGFFSTFFP